MNIPEGKRRRATTTSQWIRAEAAVADTDEDLIVEESDDSWEVDSASATSPSSFDEEDEADDVHDKDLDEIRALNKPEIPEAARPMAISAFEENTDASDSEIEEELFGVEADKRTAHRRQKKRRRRKTPLFSKSLKELRKVKQRSAVTPSVMSEEAKALYQQAQELYIDPSPDGAEERQQKAIKLLESCVAMAPGAHDPLQLLGNIYESGGAKQKSKALISYFLAALYVGSDRDAWRKVGDFAYDLQDDDTALYCYRRVCPYTRASLESDPEICYKIAELYYARYDFARAANYFTKILAHYPGDNHIVTELARCYYQISAFQDAIAVLEIGAAACLPEEERKRLFSHLMSNSVFEALGGKVLEVDWPMIELLIGIYMEQNMWMQAEKVVKSLLKFAGALSWSVLPLPVAVRLAACAIRLRRLASGEPLASVGRSSSSTVPVETIEPSREATHAVDMDTVDNERVCLIEETWERLINSNDDTPEKLFVLIADAYLEAGKPCRALACYKRIEHGMSVQQNSEFWLKVAKCHIQLHDFEQAAVFLESVIPRGRHGTLNIQERVRDLEARLLLFEVLAHLEDQTDNNVPTSLCGRGRDILANFNDTLTTATMDHRIHQLNMSGDFSPIPEALTSEVRKIILSRLSVHLDALNRAPWELVCFRDAEEWIQKMGLDTFPRPTVPRAVVDELLPRMLRALYFTGCDSSGALSLTTILRALIEQPPTAKQALPQITCPLCKEDLCGRVLQYFYRLWRCMWISEFVLLIRDTNFDMRRILSQSSQMRAQVIARQLAKEQGQVESQLKDFDGIAADEARRLRDSNFASRASGGEDGTTEADFDAADREVEQRFVLKLTPKELRTDVRRRKQRVEKGYASRVTYHSRLRTDLQLISLEDELGWEQLGHLMEAGARILAQEKMGRLAVELIESCLMSLRFSRAQVSESYARGRIHYKNRLSRLSLRLSFDGHLMRIALSRVRLKYLLPIIRAILRGGSDPMKLSRNEENAFGRSLTIYASLLFTDFFAHHAVKSISSSPERDIISFNRAWCTRHLMDFPHSFGLTMMAAHYCLLSMRWPYAVAEYTRAMHMKPSNTVASLCLATCSLGFSTSRGVQDRHQVVLRGFALLKRHERLRKQNRRELIAQLHQWSVAKARRIVRCGQEDHGHEFVDHLKKALVREGFTVSDCSESDKEWLADSLATCLNAAVTKIIEAVTAYFEAERAYNMSRAYHQLSLEHLAITGYLEAIDVILKIRRKYPMVLDLMEKQCAVLMYSRFRMPSAISVCEELFASPFTPAGIGKHLQLPLGKHQIGEIPEGELGLTLLLAKTSLSKHSILQARLEIGRKSKNNPLVRSTKGLWGLDSAKVNGKNKGLFGPADESSAREANSCEKEAAMSLKEYLEDLPPGVFMLGVDLKQLEMSAAHNASAIHRVHDSFSAARKLVRDTIIWKD